MITTSWTTQCRQNDQHFRVEADTQIINKHPIDGNKTTQKPLDHEEQIEKKMGLYVISADKSDI
jgi:hypothetical protein